MLHEKIFKKSRSLFNGVNNKFKSSNKVRKKKDVQGISLQDDNDGSNENIETENMLKQIEKHRQQGSYQSNEEDITRAFIENAPAVKFANIVLLQAINKKASDIHFEPFQSVVLIRFRVDGTIQEFMKISKDSYYSICTRIKIMASMNIAEKRIPQDGRSVFKNEGKNYDFRVSSLPTAYGEKLVIRIMYKSELNYNIKELDEIIDSDGQLSNVLKNRNGMILITGPTGSGKSTTLYTMLKRLNNSEKNIVTIEDPIEYEMFGINQVSLNLKAGLTFESGLRCILRQDPDIIMIGEIRDEETAQIAVRAAITGHLVFSTLHTKDAPSSVNRLADMGVKNYLVADALIAIMAQRLVKIICPHCKTSYTASEQQKEKLNIKNHKLYKGIGCEKCDFTGYSGRKIVYEMMYFTAEHRRIIERKGSIEELRSCSTKNGMILLKDYCANLVSEGITTYEEFLKVALIDN